MEKKLNFKKFLLPVLMVILAVLLIVSMLLSRGTGERKKTFWCFDTEGSLTDYSYDSDKKFAKNYQTVYDTLKHYHDLFDIYNPHEGISGLYEVNRNAGVAPVKVPSELIDFLEFCKEVYLKTDGEVNIAMGAVLSLWHECRTDAATDPMNARIPDTALLAEAAGHCDINNLIIDRQASTVYLADGKMSLDVGAVGKGYAVERAAEQLISAGAEGYVLDVGGNIRILGAKPSGEGFRTGIRDPFGREDGYAKILTLSDISSVTSGGYERYYTVGDKKYHHIIDKDTLFPAELVASVTVVCEDSGLADALSTALFCMDERSGLALVESLEGVEAVWVKKDGSVICSSGMDGYVN